MPTPEQEALENVAKVAALGGVKGKINAKANRFEARYTFEAGRDHWVFVRPKANGVVSIFAACLKVKKGFLKGIKKEQALDLLQRNERMPFARYGVAPLDGEDLIVASVDHRMDTLDPAELATHMAAVARAADAYEKEHERDDY